jgi:uncharacterized membrane protein YbhN (UPF0104 family)
MAGLGGGKVGRMAGGRRRALVWAVRIVGTAAAIAYIASVVELDAVGAAIGHVSAGAFAVATALVALNVVAGAARWRLVLAAYGAPSPPPSGALVRHYLVAFFYNNYLPGAVVGDVARGVVTRDAFGEGGLPAAMAVVWVERLLGLAALFVLLVVGEVLAGDALAPAESAALWIWTGLGVAGSAVAIAAVAAARRLAPRLPARLGATAGRLPVLRDYRALAAAALLSFATQALIAIAGWVLLAALAPSITLAQALLIVPLAAATTFLPVTVGGAGAREAVFVALGARWLGMAEADALAASLALWAAHLVVAAAGGLAQVQLKMR